MVDTSELRVHAGFFFFLFFFLLFFCERGYRDSISVFLYKIVNTSIAIKPATESGLLDRSG